MTLYLIFNEMNNCLESIKESKHDFINKKIHKDMSKKIDKLLFPFQIKYDFKLIIKEEICNICNDCGKKSLLLNDCIYCSNMYLYENLENLCDQFFSMKLQLSEILIDNKQFSHLISNNKVEEFKQYDMQKEEYDKIVNIINFGHPLLRDIFNYFHIELLIPDDYSEFMEMNN